MVRVDANVSMGTGHAMRCLALAQGWQAAGGNVVFIMAESTPSIDECVRAERIEIIKLSGQKTDHPAEPAAIAKQHQPAWVVIDGYHFGSRYQQVFNKDGWKVLVIDDLAQCRSYLADIVVDQNPQADAAMYVDRQAHTNLLLGPEFVVLRNEFQRWRNYVRGTNAHVRTVLVTVGGSDPDQLLLRLVEGLKTIAERGCEVIVLAGGSNCNADSLRRMIGNFGSLRLVRHTENISELMVQCDIAITCAGGTLWELLHMRCPTLSYFRTPTQAEIVSELEAMGAVRSLGDANKFKEDHFVATVDALMSSPESREKMSQIGRSLVDGDGVARIIQRMLARSGLNPELSVSAAPTCVHA